MSLGMKMKVLECVVAFLVMGMFAPRAQALLGIPDFLEFGKCANVTLKDNFDPVKYQGLWFDIESVPNEYQHTKKCVTQNYTWSGEIMNVATRGLTAADKKVRQGAAMHVEVKSVPVPNAAHMTVDAAGVPAAPYQILSTDYRSYSCVYSCLESFGFRAEFFWVFARAPTLDVNKIQLCHRVFTDMKVDSKKMIPITQGEACPYYEKLNEMLETNEQFLLKILGPEVANTTRIESATNAAPQTPHQEGDIQKILKVVDEEMKVIQDLETKVNVKQTDEEVTLAEEDNQPPATQEDVYDSGSSLSTSLLLMTLLPALILMY